MLPLVLLRDRELAARRGRGSMTDPMARLTVCKEFRIRVDDAGRSRPSILKEAYLARNEVAKTRTRPINFEWRAMMQFGELEPRATIESQLSDTLGPVVLLNVFTLEPQDAEGFLRAWSAEAEFLKRRPGYISTQLYQGVGGTTMYVNYAVWESAASFAAAFHTPEFKEHAKQFPASVTALPHLIRKIAVPGQCVG